MAYLETQLANMTVQLFQVHKCRYGVICSGKHLWSRWLRPGTICCDGSGGRVEHAIGGLNLGRTSRACELCERNKWLGTGLTLNVYLVSGSKMPMMSINGDLSRPKISGPRLTKKTCLLWSPLSWCSESGFQQMNNCLVPYGKVTMCWTPCIGTVGHNTVQYLAFSRAMEPVFSGHPRAKNIWTY